jgi:hypothetical protein
MKSSLRMEFLIMPMRRRSTRLPIRYIWLFILRVPQAVPSLLIGPSEAFVRLIPDGSSQPINGPT